MAWSGGWPFSPARDHDLATRVRSRPRQLLRRGGSDDPRPTLERPAGILRAMRLSNLFFTTLRDDPAEAEMPSHRLLVRAGYVRQLGAGLYSLLPLGFRVTKRVEQVIREEMNAIGGQEMEMPVVHPAEVWKDSGRYDKIGPELVRFKDRGDRDMVLAMTHEEVVALLLRDIVQSYRQLPVQLYHFQTKFRDEPRSRGRPDPRPRVRDEGRLQLRPRRRRARRELSQAVRRLREDLQAARARRDPGRCRRRDHGRHPAPTSSWSSTTTARTPSSCATPAATPRTSRSPSVAKPDAGGRGPLPDGGRRDARRDDDRCAGQPTSASRERGPPRRRSS